MDALAGRGFPVFRGALGENLTTRGLGRRSLRIGQRFGVGEAVIQLTEVRVPCSALRKYGTGLQAAIFDERAMVGDPATPVWGMSGFYACVVQPGVLRPGDAIAMVK
ncbi:MAG TPA: MOSC domain-containing protein [Bryobacteraceae bacterium]|nr:MOSC domain-containing protein [Bryobacteraceae bacterium]